MMPTPKPQTTRPAIIGPRLVMAQVDMMPPARKMQHERTIVYLRPMRCMKNEAVRAPKKAPTCSSETTLEPLSSLVFVSAV
jgi:hypothetical protein